MIDAAKYKRWTLAIVALAALGHDGQVWALEATISARYRGDVQGRFENTTPQAAFCNRWPADCHGVQTVGLPIEYLKTSMASAPNPRDQFFIKLPSLKRVTVVNERGVSHELTFEITHVSQWVGGSPGVNPAFTAYPRGGCRYRLTYGSASLKRVLYLWSVSNPSSPSDCYSTGQGALPGDTIDSVVNETGISYNLKMPSPLKMTQGLYRGSVDFTVGPGGDFDFGNGVTELNDTRLTLNFELDVQHAFVLQFPPGSDRAVLEPPGGWQAWLGGRAAPPRLERDIPFRIWSTGPFKVYMKCNVLIGRMCGVVADDDNGAVVDVLIDLPPEIRYQDKPARRIDIPRGRDRAVRFEHMLPASNRPANLHFEMSSNEVEHLFRRPGVVHEGIITLIFDSDL